jgi:hypothetical protein
MARVGWGLGGAALDPLGGGTRCGEGRHRISGWTANRGPGRADATRFCLLHPSDEIVGRSPPNRQSRIE